MLLFCLHSHAYTEYWFQAETHATPTGAGKVYSSQKDVNIDTIPATGFKEETSYLWSVKNRGEAATSSIHLYAKPSAGYAFKNWTYNGTEISKISHCAPSLRSAKQDREDPQIEHFYANFVPKGSVAVYSSNEGAGNVYIDEFENDIGDEVTLTAISNIFIGEFKGWVIGERDFENVDLNDLDFVSREEVFTFTITEENKGDYYAVFDSRDVKQKGMYCMVRNRGTHNCVGLKGTKELTLAEEQRYYKNSIELIPYNKSHHLPATVINIRGDYNGVGGLTGAEYISQGFSSKNIKGTETSQAPRLIKVEQYTTETYLTYAEGSDYTDYWVDFHADSIKSREELIGEVYHPWTGNDSEISNYHQWEFLPLTEEFMDEYYFGASPSAKTKKDGKYYTTMYTAFPYKCMDGVKAYIADKFAGQGRIHIKEIESGIVPAYTAVLLECNGLDAKENRLIPVLEDVAPLEDTNLLKGEIWLNDESGNPDNYRTRFDSETMRVLSDDLAAFVNKNNKDIANGDTLLTYIANNTCYLDLSTESSPSSNYTWTTDEPGGEDDPTTTLIDGIYYIIHDDDNTAEVTSHPNSYIDNISIPSTITYNGKSYSVTSIEGAAFYNCSSLTSITIPSSVTNIGDKAFEGCTSLTSVYVNNPTPISINSSTFPDRFNETLYVPGGSKEAYLSATYWKDFKDIIEKYQTTDIDNLSNAIYIPQSTAKQGDTVTLSVRMKNKTITVRGYQFDLYLPDGISFAKDNDGYYQAALSTNRTTERKMNYFDCSMQSDGALRVLCSSTNGATFDDTDGEVCTIMVNVDKTAPAQEYALQVKNAVLTNPEAIRFPLENTVSILAVSESPGSQNKKGDVNEDGSIDISDVLLLVDMILGKERVTPQRLANGDVNEDGTIDISDVLMVVDIILGKVTLETFVVNGVQFRMVKVAGGTFQMGATAEQGNDYKSNELPVHQVTLSDYYIGETEVTQGLWKAVMGSNPSYFSGSDNLPVEMVSWDDCQEFITRLNQLTGQKFRLPTEAEWEYAARGGNASKGFKYTGSNDVDDVAWYNDNSSDKTHVMGTKRPNELGLYDMSGNVCEWCEDRWGSYSSNSQVNPTGPSSGSFRVVRGGSWFHYEGLCRVSARLDLYHHSERYSSLGFRLAQ